MFTIAFWKTCAEKVVVGACTGFTASLVNTTTPTLKDLGAAGVGAGLGALYAFVTQLGGVQQAAGILKVAVTPKAAAR